MRRQNCARRHVRGLTEATTASWAASPVLLLPLILSFALCSLSWPRLTSDKDYTLCYNILRGPLGPRDYLLAVLIDSLGSRLSRKILTILCQLNFKKKRASSQTDQKVNAPLPPCKLKTKWIEDKPRIWSSSFHLQLLPSSILLTHLSLSAGKSFSLRLVFPFNTTKPQRVRSRKRGRWQTFVVITQLFWIFPSKNYSKLKTLCWHGSVQVLLLLKL